MTGPEADRACPGRRLVAAESDRGGWSVLTAFLKERVDSPLWKTWYGLKWFRPV